MVFADGAAYLAHRVIWKMFHGVEPDILDHEKNDPSDNRICKIRAATDAQNCFNRRVHKNNKAGLKGVYWDRGKNRYRAHIRYANKQYHLGWFRSAEEAHMAYCFAALKAHGQFANFGDSAVAKKSTT